MRKKVNSEFVQQLNPQEVLLTRIKINLKCKNEKQKDLVKSISNKEITLCAGIAGTGKTFIACAEALKLLTSQPHIYNKIIAIKSVTILEGEDIGYLKGSMQEKMEPFIMSFLDNFHKLVGKEITHQLMFNEMIQVLPVGYIRGRTLDNCIIVIDESQNLSRHHLISILTRIGENSKMIFLGDTDQIDLKDKNKSAFRWLINMFKNFSEFGVIEFSDDDSVRNPLINKILNHIKESEAKEAETKSSGIPPTLAA